MRRRGLISNKHLGFTIIEVLVVMGVIAILATAGFLIYSGVKQPVANSVKKADVDSIAKALETNYDFGTAQYPSTLDDGWFASGKVPVPPEGGNYYFGLSENQKSFRVCSVLNTTEQVTCNENSGNCYCKDSAQTIFMLASVPPPPPPAYGYETEYGAEYGYQAQYGSQYGAEYGYQSQYGLEYGYQTQYGSQYGSQYGVQYGYQTEPTSMTIFVKTPATNGALTNLAGADTLCQNAASGAGLSGTFKAWLSNGTTSAASRLTQSSLPYKLVNGVTVANNWTDLTDGSLSNLINISQTGAVVSGNVWTNTNSGGSLVGTNHCNSWGSGASNRSGVVGTTTSTGLTWTVNTTVTCNTTAYLYCLEQ